MISSDGSPLQWLVFCLGIVETVLNYSFTCKPTNYAFGDEGEEGYCKIGLGFGGQQTHGRHEILGVSLRFYLQNTRSNCIFKCLEFSPFFPSNHKYSMCQFM